MALPQPASPAARLLPVVGEPPPPSPNVRTFRGQRPAPGLITAQANYRPGLITPSNGRASRGVRQGSLARTEGLQIAVEPQR